MIVISGDLIKKIPENNESQNVFFLTYDNEDVYNLFANTNSNSSVPGILHYSGADKAVLVSDIGKDSDKVRVIIQRRNEKPKENKSLKFTKATGYIRDGIKWEIVPVQIVPVRNELFSRFGGLIETDVLSSKRVSIFGLGSGGSPIVMELAKSGIMNFDLMDHDRLEVGNLVRHAAGMPHIGRYKTKVMSQLISEKNPYAKVSTIEEKISWNNVDKVRDIIRNADICICATDNRPSKLILNRLCVEENKPCIFAGAFRRAYGGQILFVRPNVSLCYQCFLMTLPEQAADEEVSNPEHAEGLAYTDRPVPIEPGLSTDIAPISLMVVKLVIQELLKGKATTLRSLDEDLVAPWYLWINRREKNTQYESMKPLEFNVDGLRVLRWYGIAIERHPNCPVCGKFEHYPSDYQNERLPFSNESIANKERS